MAELMRCPACGKYYAAGVRECTTDFQPLEPESAAPPSEQPAGEPPKGDVGAEVTDSEECGECQGYGDHIPGCTREQAAPRSSAQARPAAVLEFPWGRVAVGETPLVVGRGADLLQEFGHYANLSRRHASVSATGDGLHVLDLGSTNGTFVNDQRLAAHQGMDLTTGDRVRFAASLRATVVEAEG